MNLQLVSNESNDIKWLSSGDGLIAGTFGGDFIIDSGDGSPLTPANTNVKKQTSWGSEAIQPKRIGNYLYYVQRFARKLRELFFIWDVNSYKSLDKTILSPHICGTESTAAFNAIAYQQNPDTVIWALCTNGTIATFTREVDQEVQGWTRQTTDGTYESIASIPSQDGPHDEIWVVVNRSINGSNRRYMERFYSQLVPQRQDKCVYLHSALGYDAYDATAANPTAASISLSITAGTSCVITCNTAYFSANDVGQRIRAIDANGATVGELKITGFTSSTIIVGDVKKSFDATSYAAGVWGLSVTTISGLGHLEAKSVGVLADGGVDKPAKTVSNASITLAYDYFVVQIGIPYTQKILTLPKEAGSQRGTSQGKKQRISEVGFKVNRSFTGFKIGRDSSTLTKIQFRNPSTPMGTPEPLFTGTIPNNNFPGNYEYGAQMLIQNDEPFPIELLNLIIFMDTIDK